MQFIDIERYVGNNGSSLEVGLASHHASGKSWLIVTKTCAAESAGHVDVAVNEVAELQLDRGYC